ncbi:MAG: glutamate--tRNA ligase [Fibrobacterales bacterium]
MSTTPRVRFAPSPTGYLHVGGARTALFNWLFAKATGGKFILRIEDTDRARYNEEALHDLIRDLKWLGLNWDEGIEVGGDFGPYQQSERLELYKKCADELVEKGEAYYCFCASERLQELREKQEAEKAQHFGYDGHCRDLNVEESRKRITAGEAYVIRLKTPSEGETTFKDYLRGTISYQNSVLDDLVLFKRDGYPTYHLASVVDDHHMQISHVLRGDEWIASTPKHALLYDAFDWERPEFVHLPVILSATGGKLSKRKGAASVGDYKELGYLPETLFNFLALLGWSPGDDREKMSLEEMISSFSLDRIIAKSAVFDEKKLEWLNGQYFNEMDAVDLFSSLVPIFKSAGITLSDYPYEFNISVISLIKEGCKRLEDFLSRGAIFYREPTEFDEKAVKKVWKPGTEQTLAVVIERFEALDTFNAEQIDSTLKQIMEDLELGFGKVAQPVRLALSGVASGADLMTTIELIGKAESVKRLSQAVKRVEELAE